MQKSRKRKTKEENNEQDNDTNSKVVGIIIDANSPAFGGRLTLFCLVSRSPALVHKSPAFYVHY